jgi:hypothetical protein
MTDAWKYLRDAPVYSEKLATFVDGRVSGGRRAPAAAKPNSLDHAREMAATPEQIARRVALVGPWAPQELAEHPLGIMLAREMITKSEYNGERAYWDLYRRVTRYRPLGSSLGFNTGFLPHRMSAARTESKAAFANPFGDGVNSGMASGGLKYLGTDSDSTPAKYVKHVERVTFDYSSGDPYQDFKNSDPLGRDPVEEYEKEAEFQRGKVETNFDWIQRALAAYGVRVRYEVEDAAVFERTPLWLVKAISAPESLRQDEKYARASLVCGLVILASLARGFGFPGKREILRAISRASHP